MADTVISLARDMSVCAGSSKLDWLDGTPLGQIFASYAADQARFPPGQSQL